MTIIRINELPDGNENLTNDDLFVFMDDPSGSEITKKISLTQLRDSIGDLNTDVTIYDYGSIGVSGPETISIDYDALKQIQHFTMPSGAITLNKGNGWPTTNISNDVVLWLDVTNSNGVSMIWNIVGSNWYNQPVSGPLPSGEHLFVLRSMGSSIVQGHYIGAKTGSIT